MPGTTLLHGHGELLLDGVLAELYLDENLLWQVCAWGPILQREGTNGLCVCNVIMYMYTYRGI